MYNKSTSSYFAASPVLSLITEHKKIVVWTEFISIISIVILALGLMFLPVLSMAEQVETTISCTEGSEPVGISYGDHTAGCTIDTPTDLDRFEFCGTIGDEVRINVYSGANNMDPFMEVWDSTATVIAQSSCGNSCTFSVDITLPATGCYTMFVSDVGTDEAGDYTVQLERILPVPGSAVPIAYNSPVADTVNPATDVDHYTFNATAGTDIRLNVYAGADNMDPTIEIRDPTGLVVVNGAADGATCGNRCTFSVDLSPTVSGVYSLLIYDGNIDEGGSYELSLWCLTGSCQPAGDMISYVTPRADVIDSPVDGDFFSFNATAGTDIRLNVYAGADNMDPTIEIRDPTGLVVVNGAADGATCGNRCTFSVDLSPTVSGVYSLLIYDGNIDEGGSYELSLWCLTGSCQPAGDMISYVTPRADVIDSPVDGDFFSFNATAGTDIRLNVYAGADNMDPTIEIRDPTGLVVVNGAADGATCGNRCTFSVDISPTVSGVYSLLIYDGNIDEGGSYELSLWCLFGACDSDADGILDGNPPVSINTPVVLAYGVPSVDTISPAVDGDIFIFGATAGDLVRFNVLASADNMDPTIEIRDPTGLVVVNGAADGATCGNRCTFSVDLSPTVSGVYSLLIYDGNIDEGGSYEIGLQCLLGTCSNAMPVCGDNCIDIANGPLIPDPGGNVQRDTDGDGYGNMCDPDLNNDLIVQAADLALFKPLFFSTDPDADFDGNGRVQAGDLAILKKLFFLPPGPSCIAP